jgi:hypothetical protein
LSVVIAGMGLVLAGEFLGIVPGAQPEDLAGRYAVVGQTGNGVLVVGNDRAQSDFGALCGRILAADPKDHVYYRVHLFDPATRSALAAVARILDFDGQEYVVETDVDNVERLMQLRAMLGRISLKGWVLTRVAPELPPVLPNPMIEQMVAGVSPDSVLAAVRRLQNYRSRYSTGDSARAAAQWIAARFRAYGCDTVILQNHTTGHAPNVIGIKYGTSGQRNPYVVIDGHFDSYAASNAPGADDNASGTVSAIEACRVMRDFRFNHDLRFIAFSGEEFGLYGSEYYANQARSQGDSILGVLNFDMIAYVDAQPESLDLLTKIANPPCGPFSDWFTAVADTYTTLLCKKDLVSDNQNSDHGPFWNNGYLAFCGIEDFWPVNPYYHTPGDSIGAGYNNNAYCTEVIKAAVAALATLGEPIPLNVPMVGLFHSRLDDASGNNNGHWDAGESVAVYLTLKNFGLVTAHNVSATVSTADPYVTLFQTSAQYGTINGSDTAVNAVPYTMKASPATPREHVANFDLAIASTESTWQNTFSFRIGEYLATDPIPDGPRTPALYWAYDDVDSGYAPHPTYGWVEIRSQGTRIPFPQNDNVVAVNLPTGFGPFKFYGQRSTQVSVSADGWVAAGNYTQSNYSNTSLPGTQAPPAVIAANWDDLYPDYNSTGYVYYYHDAAGHRFIIEYDSVAYYNPRATRDKFEVIVYDTTLAAPDGNSVIVAQYMTANGFGSSTVGMQDPTRAIGIQDFYNGTLTRGAAPIAPGRAIKYTTASPVGVSENAGRTTLDAARMTLNANPVSGVAQVRFSIKQAGSAELTAFDRAGRAAATLVKQSLKPGTYTVNWNTSQLSPGVYFIRLKTGNTDKTAKAVVAH